MRKCNVRRKRMATPKLNKAWIEMRGDIRNPAFDAKNPHFGNQFASLRSVIDATIPVAALHGIAVFTELVAVDGGIGAIVHLCHESGEEKSFGPYVNRPTKLDPQGEASASTYARRYALQAVFGVVGEADDDGNAASASAFSSKQQRTKVWKALRDAAAEEDELKARETWDELNNEQQLEVWRDLSSGIRSTLKKLLASTGEDSE